MPSTVRSSRALTHRSLASAAQQAVVTPTALPSPAPRSNDQGADVRQTVGEAARDDVIGQEDLTRLSALGRHAGRPREIPSRGWWAILRRTTREALSDAVGMAAASCGFYAMLALFPAISVAISLYGLVADPVAAEDQLAALRDVMPSSTYELIASRVHDLAAAGPTKIQMKTCRTVCGVNPDRRSNFRRRLGW